MHRYRRFALVLVTLLVAACGGELDLTSVAPTTAPSSSTAETSTTRMGKVGEALRPASSTTPGDKPTTTRAATTPSPEATTSSTTRTSSAATPTSSVPTTTRSAATTTGNSEALRAARANLEDWVAEDTDFTKTEVGCLVDGIIGALDERRLIELGLDDDPYGLESSLTVVEAGKIADVMMNCLDVVALLLDGLADDDELTAKQKTCFEAKLTKDVIREFLVFSLSDEASDPPSFEIFASCMAP